MHYGQLENSECGARAVNAAGVTARTRQDSLTLHALHVVIITLSGVVEHFTD